jgi:hypothetical protein
VGRNNQRALRQPFMEQVIASEYLVDYAKSTNPTYIEDMHLVDERKTSYFFITNLTN